MKRAKKAVLVCIIILAIPIFLFEIFVILYIFNVDIDNGETLNTEIISSDETEDQNSKSSIKQENEIAFELYESLDPRDHTKGGYYRAYLNDDLFIEIMADYSSKLRYTDYQRESQDYFLDFDRKLYEVNIQETNARVYFYNQVFNYDVKDEIFGRDSDYEHKPPLFSYYGEDDYTQLMLGTYPRGDTIEGVYTPNGTFIVNFYHENRLTKLTDQEILIIISTLEKFDW